MSEGDGMDNKGMAFVGRLAAVAAAAAAGVNPVKIGRTGRGSLLALEGFEETVVVLRGGSFISDPGVTGVTFGARRVVTVVTEVGGGGGGVEGVEGAEKEEEEAGMKDVAVAG